MKKQTSLMMLLFVFSLIFWGCSDSSNPVDETNFQRVDKQARQIPPVSVADAPVDDGIRLEKPGVTVPPTLAAVQNVVVDDDGGADFTTIQDAVNSGAKKITVRSGAYAENVVIGPGAKVTIIGAEVGLTLVSGVAGTAGPIMDVLAGSDVNISDLTVDGGSAMSGGVVTGIRYNEAHGRVKNVAVLNIRDASGGAQGIGIRVQSTGPKAKVFVEKCEVSNYTRVGINGNGVGVNLTVKDCDIGGPLLPRVWAPNGIQVSRGAMGNIRGNDVDNNPSPNPPGGAGSGIILFCAGTTNVQNNKVTRADLGIAIADNANAKVHNNEIIDSSFDGISLQFIGLLFGDIGCGVTLTENNLIKNNKISGSSDTGISFANFDPTTAANTPNNNRLLINTIDDSGVDGIHVFDGEGNLIQNNEMTNSGSTDSVDDTVGGGTAGTANTWKNNICSSSSPAGLCN